MPRTPYLEQDDCIGCETCTRLCPEVFHMVDEHLAGIHDPYGAPEEKIEEAMDACPAACITWED